jgi:hypothetical protein
MQLRLTDPLFGFLGRSLMRPILLLGVLGSAVFGGFHFLGAPEDNPGSMQRSLADKICTQAVQDLPKMANVPSVAVLSLAGDDSNYLTGLLRQKIVASGQYRVLDETFFGKLMQEFGKREAAVTRLSEAVGLARQLGVDLVVFGEVPRPQPESGAGVLRLELRMAERSSGQAVFARSYSEEVGGSLILNSYWRSRIADSSKGWRIFFWILFTLLLPIAAIPLIRRLVSAESNAANLLLLLGLTVIDMFAALLLTGFWIPTVWTALILVAALGGSIFYNYCIASFVERMSH